VYSQSDVDALQLIRQALTMGYRPGEIVGQPIETLRRRVTTARAEGPPTRESLSIESLIECLANDDVDALAQRLRAAARALGGARFVVEVAHPLALRVGELWERGRLDVRHEHMVTECLSQQLQSFLAALDGAPMLPRVLLATLPGERHGLGLEMVATYLAEVSVGCLLLGVDSPADQVVKAARAHQVDAVGFHVSASSDLSSTARHVRWILSELPRRVPVWLGGFAANAVSVEDSAIWIVQTWPDLDAAAEKLKSIVASAEVTAPVPTERRRSK
jgi:methanogenic corrinoid protein MtbC1